MTIIISYKGVTSAKQYFLIPSELIGGTNTRGNRAVLIVNGGKGQLVVGYNCKRDGTF